MQVGLNESGFPQYCFHHVLNVCWVTCMFSPCENLQLTVLDVSATLRDDSLLPVTPPGRPPPGRPAPRHDEAALGSGPAGRPRPPGTEYRPHGFARVYFLKDRLIWICHGSGDPAAPRLHVPGPRPCQAPPVGPRTGQGPPAAHRHGPQLGPQAA